MKKQLWGALLCLAWVACATTRENTWEETIRTQTLSEGTLKKQGDLLAEAKTAWDERSDSAKALQAINSWRAALELVPNDPDSWASLSRALYFFGDCHLRFDSAQNNAVERSFRQGIDAAERSLITRSPGFAERMRKGERLESAVAMLDASAVPALYWRAQNLDAWSIVKGASTIFGYRGEISAMLQRVDQLSPGYGYGALNRFLGVDATRSGFLLGGGNEKARNYFEAANNSFPSYFKNKVVYADFYAAKSDDRKLYDDLLTQVAGGNPEAIPEMAAENRCEMRKAQTMLDGAKKRF